MRCFYTHINISLWECLWGEKTLEYGLVRGYCNHVSKCAVSINILIFLSGNVYGERKRWNTQEFLISEQRKG
jgi:hypothetical protein